MKKANNGQEVCPVPETDFYIESESKWGQDLPEGLTIKLTGEHKGREVVCGVLSQNSSFKKQNILQLFK